jgi:malate dehydrogenase
MIANGEVFGKDQKLILTLLDIAPMMGVLEGVVMELADCAFPLLVEVIPTADPLVAFKDVSAAFLVGAMPRREGMERKDLLSANVKIFKVQGEAMNQVAKKDVKVLVVGNPANTNALICSHYAPSIPRENFTAMTRLDQNRARAQIAQRLKIDISSVQNLIIWGNHSGNLHNLIVITKAKFLISFQQLNSLTLQTAQPTESQSPTKSKLLSCKTNSSESSRSAEPPLLLPVR